MITNKSYILLLIITCFLLTIAVGSHFLSPILIAAGICAILSAIFLLANPRVLLFVATLSMLFRGPFQASFYAYKYVDELFTILLLVFIVSNHILKRIKISTEEQNLFFPVILFSGFSAIFSQFGLHAAIEFPDFAITYFSYIIYFFAAKILLKESDLTCVIMFFVWYMLFQFLCNVGYVLGINPIPQGEINYIGDESTGTLGSGIYVAYYCLLAFFLVFSLLDNGAMRKKMGWCVFGLLMGVSFIFTNTNHAYLIALLCFSLSSIFIWQRRFFRTILLTGIICALPLWGLLMSLEFKSTDRGFGQAQATLSLDNLRNRFEITKHGPKFRVYRKAFIEGLDNPVRFLFGVGGGCGISYDALQMSNPVAMEYLGEIYLAVNAVEQLKGGSISEQPITSLSVLMVELGLLGVVCYYLTYLYLLFKTAFFYRKKRYSPNQMIIAGALCPFIVLTLIVSLLTTAFYDEFYFVTIWVLAALVWNPAAEKDSACSVESGL